MIDDDIEKLGLTEVWKILQPPYGEAKLIELNRLANRWFSALTAARIGEKSAMVVLPAQEQVQKLVYEMFGLYGMPIPHNLWGDIAEQGMNLLRELIDINQLDYKENPKFKEFKKGYFDRVEQISKMPEYAGMFGDGYY